jgi:DNA-binding MarR family transcriptional regulator
MARASEHGRTARSPSKDLPPSVDDADYARLAALRAGVRGYLAWAEQCANEHGLTPAQVQLALAVQTYGDPAGPTLTELAQTLLLRHHSVVGLVDRAEQAGLVQRIRDDVSLSRVHVQLTSSGTRLLESISAQHLQWLGEFGPELGALWATFGNTSQP